jgi:hypothetical protein
MSEATYCLICSQDNKHTHSPEYIAIQEQLIALLERSAK